MFRRESKSPHQLRWRAGVLLAFMLLNGLLQIAAVAFPPAPGIAPVAGKAQPCCNTCADMCVKVGRCCCTGKILRPVAFAGLMLIPLNCQTGSEPLTESGVGLQFIGYRYLLPARVMPGPPALQKLALLPTGCIPVSITLDPEFPPPRTSS